MTSLKRTVSALLLTGGAALALTPAAAHADERPVEGPPITQRVGEIVDHPGHAVQDANMAVGVTTSAVGSAAKSTNSSLTGTGGVLQAGLPKPPKAE